MFGAATVVAAAASAAALSAGTASAAPGSAVLGGSSGIVLGGATSCSLTSIGTDNAGRLVGLTAGHCGPAGTAVSAEAAPGAGVIGTVAASDGGTGLDYAVIEFDPARVTPVRTVGATTIAGLAGPPAPGGTVCGNGRSSGFDCGVVWGTVDGREINQSCSQPGDSGGPVTVGDQLVGMNQGRLAGLGGIRFNVPCVAAAFPVHSPAYFQPIGPILTAIDNSGGVGAGFRPI
ncbi:hypothetical protein JK358_04660 [Nocardia sp. 2]|uniref:Peptidase S1 n=1 Tax=Nocardia acididurans TaxID=2802282 RepID=A0ABS1LZ34_9NOCA|nr:hypothetical protein [Nocardia acididurans]